jgi:hypothetical protein
LMACRGKRANDCFLFFFSPLFHFLDVHTIGAREEALATFFSTSLFSSLAFRFEIGKRRQTLGLALRTGDVKHFPRRFRPCCRLPHFCPSTWHVDFMRAIESVSTTLFSLQSLHVLGLGSTYCAAYLAGN